ncbi:hypothetical protein HYU08_03820 [Candidatus Woesearchaeota archaeon]|nr:hypothetical protein [Candidatus Woesearchaeota archaeon]
MKNVAYSLALSVGLLSCPEDNSNEVCQKSLVETKQLADDYPVLRLEKGLAAQPWCGHTNQEQNWTDSGRLYQMPISAASAICLNLESRAASIVSEHYGSMGKAWAKNNNLCDGDFRQKVMDIQIIQKFIDEEK